MSDLTIIWIAVIIVMLIIEAYTCNLVTIWVALGAVLALILSAFTDSFPAQLIVCLVASIILIVFTRPFAKKYLKVKREKVNLDVVVGKTAIVQERITPTERGRVKVDGKSWAAIAEEEIEEGAKVEVLAIDGVKLVVRKEEEK